MGYKISLAFFFAVFSLLASADNNVPATLDSIMIMLGSANPLVEKDGKIIMAPPSFGKYVSRGTTLLLPNVNNTSLSRILKFDTVGEEYHPTKPTQKTNTVVRVSSIWTPHNVMEFQTLEMDATGTTPVAYQECWQEKESKLDVQCAMIDGGICKQINIPGFDWNKGYRNYMEPFRDEMIERFNANRPPEDFSKRWLLLKDYTVKKKYNHITGDILNDVSGVVITRMKSLCKKFTWSETTPGREFRKLHGK